MRACLEIQTYTVIYVCGVRVSLRGSIRKFGKDSAVSLRVALLFIMYYLVVRLARFFDTSVFLSVRHTVIFLRESKFTRMHAIFHNANYSLSILCE